MFVQTETATLSISFLVFSRLAGGISILFEWILCQSQLAGICMGLVRMWSLAQVVLCDC